MVGNWWYKRKGGDSTLKKKSKIWNKNFSFEALFSRNLPITSSSEISFYDFAEKKN